MANDPAQEALTATAVNKAQLESHEKVCAERYGDIKDSFGRVHDRMDDQNKEMKRIFWGVLGVLATVLWWVVTNGKLPWQSS